MQAQNTVYALKSMNAQRVQDGFLLVLNQEKGKSILEFLSQTKMKYEQQKTIYEEFGEVQVPDYIFNHVKNKLTFFVRSLENT